MRGDGVANSQMPQTGGKGCKRTKLRETITLKRFQTHFFCSEEFDANLQRENVITDSIVLRKSPHFSTLCQNPVTVLLEHLLCSSIFYVGSYFCNGLDLYAAMVLMYCSSLQAIIFI